MMSQGSYSQDELPRPGSGTEPRHRQFFDPVHYRIVLFDQRGAGRSEPLASIEQNTTWDLIADIEQLREMLGIVRGVWLCTDEEIEWWQHGTQTFFPENWRHFVDYLPKEERGGSVEIL
ncbi:MAG: hypothetical protein ETSY2_40795 [Candidatus Entotheonella gemina]|uniref:Proline iminopeptidase n=1 Tax=Candidatus Entotheonella gemina TaxID=1429439 RepID=W4LPX5_9BACT|nr:MAG: hypothetical protein ETSY2_40795 [Candidatus Entotheonella gemina]